MKIEQIERPPESAKRVYAWRDLPSVEGLASFEIRNGDQETIMVTVSKHQRQVLEGLMEHPIYAASYCRISDQVAMLRELGIDIETKMYRNDPETGRQRYGVYFLKSKVIRISLGEVAA